MNTHHTVYEHKDRSWFINVAWYVAVAALVVVLALYGVFYLKARVQMLRIARIDEKIAVYGTQEQKQHEDQVYDYKKQIDAFAAVLAEHRMSSNLFSFLETVTLSEVVFSNVTVALDQGQMRLTGQAPDMATLAKQFSLFENATVQVKHISVFNSQVAASGKVAFVFTIDLNPEMFKYSPT